MPAIPENSCPRGFDMRSMPATLILSLLLVTPLGAEQFRTQLAGALDLRTSREAVHEMGFNDSLLLRVPSDMRFVRGIELELVCPQAAVRASGSLAVVFYRAGNLSRPEGIVDVNANQLFIDQLPGRLRSLYQIPLREKHGFKTSPYARIPFAYAGSGDYLFRLMPISKGFEEGIESWRFTVKARVIHADEGAVSLAVTYPPGLEGEAWTVTVNDEEVAPVDGELILSAGEHQLTLRGPAFRTEHRLVNIAPGEVRELAIALRDPAPLVYIQTPENAEVFFDEVAFEGGAEPLVTTPGEHEVRFTIGDYTITRTLLVRLGASYEVNLVVDVDIVEKE